MPLPGTAHTARIAALFTFTLDGQQCENVFHLRDNADTMFADPTATCAVIQTALNAALLPALSSRIALTGVGFEDVRTFPFGGITVGQAPLQGTYVSTEAFLPSSVCIAIRKSTAGLGRSSRGRWYWPLGDTFNIGAQNDTVKAASITRYIAALEGLQAAIELAMGVEMGVVSYRTGNAQRANGLFQQITGWSVTDATVDSQRRRLTGRGR